MALDKPTRLPGDLIMFSSTLGNFDSKLSVPANEEPLAELPEFHENVVKGQGRHPNERYTPDPLKPSSVLIQDLANSRGTSDHMIVTRKLNHFNIMSANASFAMLLGKTMGSEALFVKAKSYRYDTPSVFLDFLGKVPHDEFPHVLGIQEYVSDPLKGRLQQMGFKLCETQSDQEGSCIAIQQPLYNPLSDKLFGFESNSEHWAVGAIGRTFSAAVANLPKPTLVLNLHAPNPAEAAEGGWYLNKETMREIEQNPNEKMFSKIPPELKVMLTTDQFKSHIRTYINLWLESILVHPTCELHRVLSRLFNECETRLVVMGDFNDASVEDVQQRGKAENHMVEFFNKFFKKSNRRNPHHK